jgi:hypothetical protein
MLHLQESEACSMYAGKEIHINMWRHEVIAIKIAIACNSANMYINFMYFFVVVVVLLATSLPIYLSSARHSHHHMHILIHTVAM